MNASQYEDFVRGAFSLAFGKKIASCKDPAGLAGAGRFSERELAAVKVAIGYAFEIYANKLFNDFDLDLPEAELRRIGAFTEQVVAAKNLGTISGVVESFQLTVIDKHCRRGSGQARTSEQS